MEMNLQKTESASTAASQAFAYRKAMRDRLLATQNAEHHFYGKVAESTEASVAGLCNEFSELLQGRLLSWPDATLQAFAKSVDIPVNELDAWREAATTMNSATVAGKHAAARKNEAKSAQLPYSGLMWGAKAGFEREFAATSDTLKKAEAEVMVFEESVRVATSKAKQVGAALLELCVSHAALLARCPTFGREFHILLTAAGRSAVDALDAHNREQLEEVQLMRATLSKLETLYGAA